MPGSVLCTRKQRGRHVLGCRVQGSKDLLPCQGAVWVSVSRDAARAGKGALIPGTIGSGAKGQSLPVPNTGMRVDERERHNAGAPEKRLLLRDQVFELRLEPAWSEAQCHTSCAAVVMQEWRAQRSQPLSPTPHAWGEQATRAKWCTSNDTRLPGGVRAALAAALPTPACQGSRGVGAQAACQRERDYGTASRAVRRQPMRSGAKSKFRSTHGAAGVAQPANRSSCAAKTICRAAHQMRHARAPST